MEIIDDNKNPNETEMFQEWENSHRRGKIFGGLIIITIGSLFLARELGYVLPYWLFTWKMLLIVIGLFIGVKHKFQRRAWIALVLIGTAFLMRDLMPELIIGKFMWPVAIIIIGIFMVFKPKRSNNHWQHHNRWRQRRNEWKYKHGQCSTPTFNSSEDHIELNVVFGSIKKNIISKDLKGGEINVVFGGTELNLTQADFNEKMSIEVNVVFGGAKLIVPPYWKIQPEITAVLGGVEDKRGPYTGLEINSKTLILKGSVCFGGIEIISY